MDFTKRMKPSCKKSIFKEEGYLVWCGSVVKSLIDRKYYLYYSRWKEEMGHDAWVIASEVAYAVSEHALGPFKPVGVALKGSGGGKWDADCIHNPTVHCFEGKYYLYYMGNYGDGTYWNHRNHQRVGIAIADDPRGPWQRFDTPLIDVSEQGFDCLVTSNPTVAKGKDGLYYLVYKAVGKGKLPKGGDVVCGVAIAEHPEGPFIKQPYPIMTNPEAGWSVEDPFIWYEEGRFYALVKDFQGYFTKREEKTIALFTSYNGVDWHCDKEHPFAFGREIRWEDGTIEKVDRRERPQLLIENGVPTVLYTAVAQDKASTISYNLATALKR